MKKKVKRRIQYIRVDFKKNYTNYKKYPILYDYDWDTIITKSIPKDARWI